LSGRPDPGCRCRKGIGYLKQALEIDPEFALAWAQLAKAYVAQADTGWVPAVEGVARAREALARALALEPDLPEGHAGMGWIEMIYEWDWHAAEASLQRALELAPGNGDVLIAAGAMAYHFGRLDDTIALFRQVVAQDPLRTSGYTNLAAALNASDRRDEAEAAYRQVLEFTPQQAVTRSNLAFNLLMQGRGGEALTEASREPEEATRLWIIAIIEHAAGRRAESNTALQELIAKYATDSAYQVAEVYGARGEADLAFDWLERAYVQRDPGLADMKTNPRLRSLHADPRWIAFLLRGLGRTSLPRAGAAAESVTADRYVRYQRLTCTTAAGRRMTKRAPTDSTLLGRASESQVTSA
jgi:Tfp pilus assembly protein PilF